jgi:hypothetical protein
VVTGREELQYGRGDYERGSCEKVRYRGGYGRGPFSGEGSIPLRPWAFIAGAGYGLGLVVSEDSKAGAAVARGLPTWSPLWRRLLISSLGLAALTSAVAL